jgi:DivIVA domain-containing protein
MLFDEISLTPQELLEKEFKIDTRGYRPQEVDRFLDIIINDYTKFISIIKKLEIENKDLIEENMRLKHELRNTKDKLEIVKNSSKEITNVDLLRRISQLEKVIFGENNNDNNNL